MEYNREPIMPYFVLSDPYEIRQQEVSTEVINKVRENLFVKLFLKKSNILFVEEIRRILFLKKHMSSGAQEMLKNYIPNHLEAQKDVSSPKL